MRGEHTSGVKTPRGVVVLDAGDESPAYPFVVPKPGKRDVDHAVIVDAQGTARG